MRARDFQREKAYRWERTAFANGRNLATVEQCQALVDLAAEAFHIAPPTVIDGRGRRRGGFITAANAITLPRACRHERYVLHEVCHAILGGQPVPWHGAEFTAKMLEVCAWWGLARSDTRERGIAMGLKIGGRDV